MAFAELQLNQIRASAEQPRTSFYDESLAELATRYALAGQPVVIAVNNKAEGSAPLSCVKLAREIADACARLAQHAPEPGAEAAPPVASGVAPVTPP